MMTKSNTLDQPVFIVGPLRSGTTLLRLMLHNHPKMNFFGEFEGAVSQANDNDFPSISNYHKFIETDRMMQDSNFIIDESLNYVDLVKSFLQQEYNNKKVEVIGACIHSRFDLVSKIWPNAKFIHITRDPRDVAKSTIPMGWAGNTYHGAKYWLEPEMRWDKLKNKLNDEDYIEVKYETLIRETAEELTKVCNFLGQDYNANMPNIDKVSTYAKPNPKLVEQWKLKQTDDEINHVESQCRQLMTKLDYKEASSANLDPSSFKIFYLKINNKIKKVEFNINRYGLYLYTYRILSNKIPAFKNPNMTNKLNSIEREYLK